MTVGTGDVPGTLGFYRNCGFKYSHRIKNFFTDNYDHPIVEDGLFETKIGMMVHGDGAVD